MEYNIDIKKKPNEFAPLVLAYIGDAVYEVYVRTRVLAAKPDVSAHVLHKESIHYVSAHSQSESIHHIEQMLTEEEMRVYKRGRNAKSYTSPKHADLIDYRHATGFEALVGWLYLSSKTERLEEIMCAAFENCIKNPS